MDDLRQVFERFDGDESGYIEVDELDDVLRQLGLNTRTDDAALAAVAKLETEDPSRVSWEELSAWWTAHGAGAASTKAPRSEEEQAESQESSEPTRTGDLPDEEALRRLFDRFDEDGSGYIEQTELAHLIEAAGREPDDAEVVAALDSFDFVEDGRLSWKEFLGWWDDLMNQTAS